MSDDTKKTPASLSVPQATANLDDVLASIEQQAAGTSPSTTTTQTELQPPATTPPIVSPVAEPTPVIETAPVVQSETPVLPIAPEKTFSVEETHIEPKEEITAPTPQPLESAASVQDHPQVTFETPVIAPIQDASVVTPPEAGSPPPKKGLFGSFFNPKFAIGAAIVAIMAVGGVATYISSQAPTGSLDTRQKATGCQIDYNGNSFTTINCTGSITTYNGPSCPTTLHPAGSENISGGTHTYNPSPPYGECQQIDHNFSGEDLKNPGTILGAGGVCTCNNPAPPKQTCGGSCTSDSDCINPSGAGATVVCRSGTCQNAACPAGMTQPGANCACNAGRSCGQTCGTTIGLCTDGVSTCTYINTNGPVCSWGWTQFYCAGSMNGYQRLMCTSGDTGGGYLVGPSGKMSGFTQAEIAASCTKIATPTPVPTPTPTLLPSPTPTPTATPIVTTAPLVCMNITKDIASPVIGSQVRFTCGTVAGATSYEFRYKYAFNGGADQIGSIAANANISVPLVISQPATYKVQCRPCIGQACSQWEAW